MKRLLLGSVKEENGPFYGSDFNRGPYSGPSPNINQQNCSHEIGYGDLELESDAEVVIDSLQNGEVEWTEFGDIIERCKRMLEENPRYQVNFVSKCRNIAAHVLARQS